MASPSTQENDPLQQITKFPNFRSNFTPLPSVVKWANSLSTEDAVTFRKRYGTIISLLSIKVEKPLLQALVSFWDPENICFRFGEFELVPTLEEYARLLDQPFDVRNLAQPHLHGGNKKRVSQLLGIYKEHLESVQGLQEEYTKCSVKYLTDRFSDVESFCNYKSIFIGGEEGWKASRLSALAFTIFGHVLFPHNDNLFVDARLAYIVEQVEKNCSYIPMLLSETFRSLCYSYEHTHSSFFGWATLLQVWLLQHLKEYQRKQISGYCGEDLIHKHTTHTRYPHEFSTKEAWAKYLSELPFEKFMWKPNWHHANNIVMQCEGFHCVHLVGLRSITVYSPSRVLRQYNWVQVVPEVENLRVLFYDYKEKESQKKVKETMLLWSKRDTFKKPTREDENIPSKNCATREYNLWIKEKMGKRVFTAPEVEMDGKKPLNSHYEDFLTEYRMRHEIMHKAWLSAEKKLTEENHQLKLTLKARDEKIAHLEELFRGPRDEGVGPSCFQNSLDTHLEVQHQEEKFVEKMQKRLREF